MSGLATLLSAAPDSGEPLSEEFRCAPGTMIDGVFRILSPLGSGSMGVVLLAQDESLDRRVAIKFILSSLHNEEFRERFKDEARAMARVSHPNVLPIFAFGEHHGDPYFVTEYVDGQTVDQWLASCGGTHPDIGLVLDILDGVCDGLSAIHAADTAHRDLKPSNILLDAKLRPRIADMGLALLCRRDGDSKPELVGTPAYMAPEVACPSEFAPAAPMLADIYSLGCVAYELFTGRAPFGNDGHVGLILQHVIGEVERPTSRRPDLPPELDAILLRALAKNPADRTPSIDVFRHELDAIRSGSPEPERILVADDHEDFRSSFEILLGLEFPGVEIECVGDGLSALAAFERKRPSVMICDLQMPGLDGMQLTGELRRRDPQKTVPIIVLTASGGPNEWQRLSSMGADRFFVKPIIIDDVVAMVRRCLQERYRSKPPRSMSPKE